MIERALAYPFEAPAASYILLGDTVLELLSYDADKTGSCIVRGPSGVCSLAEEYTRRYGSPFEENPTIALLASGSNASPQRLMEKFPSSLRAAIPALLGTVHRLCPVYSAHITRYGSVSATLQWAEASTARVFCLLLPESLLEIMHRSEFVGTNYGYFHLGGVRFKPDLRHEMRDPFAYLSLWGGLSLNESHVRLAAYDSHGVEWPSLTQRQIMDEVHSLLSPEQGLDDFILSNIGDKSLRQARSRILSKDHAHAIELDRFDRLR